jgi:N-acetylneuraminic acid mutarotase
MYDVCVKRSVLVLLLLFVGSAAVSCDDNDGEVTIDITVTSEDRADAILFQTRLGGWSTLASMPTPRAEVAAAAIERKIYVAGGFTANGTNSDIVEAYDIDADTWSSIAPMPERLDHAMAAAVSDKLYVIGGWRVFGEQASDAAYEYDPATAGWRSVASLPIPRAAGAAATVGSTIYIVGGVGPESEVALAYDADENEWVRIASIAEPREHLSAAVVDGRVFAIGGRWSDRGNVATVEEYDADTNEWHERAPMPTARGGLGSAATEDVIHVVGGESFGGDSRTFEEHELYLPLDSTGWRSGDRWSDAAELPNSRHGLAVVAIGLRLYAIAGGETPGLSVSGIVEVYQPSESRLDLSHFPTQEP